MYFSPQIHEKRGIFSQKQGFFRFFWEFLIPFAPSENTSTSAAALHKLPLLPKMTRAAIPAAQVTHFYYMPNDIKSVDTESADQAVQCPRLPGQFL